MVSGAGAVLEEHYGLSTYVGGIGLAVAVGLTVWFGLKSLVDVIGKMGPLIVVVAIALGILGIVRNPAGVVEGVVFSLACIIVGLGLLPFDQMVNLVYVINGYVGILLLVLMILRTLMRTARRQPL